MSELRLDIGCGEKVRDGFEGIDIINYGQKYVFDVRNLGLHYFENESVAEIFCSHFLEHLDSDAVIKFLKDCLEIMKSGAKMHVIVPHKDNPKAYVLWHKTFFTEHTFKDLGIMGFVTQELITNARGDIHWIWKK